MRASAIRRGRHGIAFSGFVKIDMHKTVQHIAGALLAAVLISPAYAGGSGVVVRERFESIAAWRPLLFPKIAAHTRYRIVEDDGRRALKAEARASASGLIHSTAFDVTRAPVLRWRWKVSNVYEKGDATRKDGDDYPLRIYVVFTYDPSRASLGLRARYALARRLYGEYPPHSSLNYIWASREHQRRILPNPYTERAMMVVVRSGGAQAGQWLEEEVNMLEDYRAAFGEDPPREAYLAIMSDADNTGESAVAHVEYIEVLMAP